MAVALLHGGLVLAALAVGAALASRAPPSPVSGWVRAALSFSAVVGGALGAKLPFVLSDPGSWASHTSWFTDGRTLVWGLAGGYLTVEAAKAALGVTARTGDGFVVAVAASVAIGRLSCFWPGCCYGTPTALPWGVDFGDGVPRHPTQLYESLFHGVAAAVAAGTERRGLLSGRRFQAYLLAYCGFRFATEWIRPEPAVALGMTAYQWSVLGIGVVMAGILWQRSYRPAVACA